MPYILYQSRINIYEKLYSTNSEFVDFQKAMFIILPKKYVLLIQPIADLLTKIDLVGTPEVSNLLSTLYNK